MTVSHCKTWAVGNCRVLPGPVPCNLGIVVSKSGSETRVFVNRIKYCWLSHPNVLLSSWMLPLPPNQWTQDHRPHYFHPWADALLWGFRNKHFSSSSSTFQSHIKRASKEVYVNAISVCGAMLKIQIHSKNRMANTFYSTDKHRHCIISCCIYCQVLIFVLYTDVIICVTCHGILYDLDIAQKFFHMIVLVWS